MGNKSYQFTRINKLSFRIKREHRATSTLTLNADKFQWDVDVHVHNNDEYWHDQQLSYQLSAYDCNALIERIATSAMLGWKSPKYDSSDRRRWIGAKEWSIDQIKKAIAKRVSKCWREAVEEAYPKWFLDLHARIFSVTYCLPEQSVSVALLDTRNHDPYLISDIMNYRAAAHALLLGSIPVHDFDNPASLFLMAGRDGRVALKDVLWQWTSVYDVDHVLNRSKRRTIMNMPAHMSTVILRYFKYLNLDRPLLTKQAITWACVMADKFGRQGARHAIMMNNKSILYPTSADLNNAVCRYAAMVGEPMSVNATKTYGYLAQYLWDAVYSRTGWTGAWTRSARTVTSLLKTADKIHREMVRQHEENFGNQYISDPEAETMLPPITLPKHKAITFLKTAGEIGEEGKLMQHCISNYADNAVLGGIYIFHIEHKGDIATAAVSSNGNLVQSHGPRNRQNKAAKLGQRVLRAWAVGLALNKVDNGMKLVAAAADNMALRIGDFAEVMNE